MARSEFSRGRCSRWGLPAALSASRDVPRDRRAYGPTRSTHPVVTPKVDGVLGLPSGGDGAEVATGRDLGRIPLAANRRKVMTIKQRLYASIAALGTVGL